MGKPKKSESDYHTVHHSNVTPVRKEQECVTQHNLGFGGDAKGGMWRLVIYAQAAGGDLLVGAIDMVDKEQRAYRERL